MVMNKKIKLFIVTIVIAIGFLFTASFTLSAHAEELPNTDEAPTTEVEATDEEEEKKEETTTKEAAKSEQEVVDFFLAHLKQLKWSDAEAIIGWVIAYFVANLSVIVACFVKILLDKLKETKQSKAFQEAFAKLSLENQEKINALITDFESKLEAVNAENKELLAEYKENLDKLQNDKTKTIAEELSKVNDLLLKK
jgi:uncharacterized membrane protein YraQ (UPF0718 family)